MKTQNTINHLKYTPTKGDEINDLQRQVDKYNRHNKIVTIMLRMPGKDAERVCLGVAKMRIEREAENGRHYNYIFGINKSVKETDEMFQVNIIAGTDPINGRPEYFNN